MARVYINVEQLMPDSTTIKFQALGVLSTSQKDDIHVSVTILHTRYLLSQCQLIDNGPAGYISRFLLCKLSGDDTLLSSSKILCSMPPSPESKKQRQSQLWVLSWETKDNV